MMYIGICEDELSILNYLNNLAEKFFSSKAIEYEIIKTNSSASILEYADLFNIVLLDIELKEKINGIDVGIALREKNKHAQIAYITGYKDYGIAAYETHCFHFLVKPVGEEKILKLLQDILDYNDARQKKIKLMSAEGIVQVKVSSICYFEAQKYKTSMRTLNKEYILNMSLSDVAKLTEKYDFSYSHKGYLVNLENVVDVDKEIKLKNGIVVPLATRRTKEFKNVFHEYLYREI